MTAAKGGVAAPKGFRAAGVAAGIKPGSTKKDCALIASDSACTVAGTFTQNRVKAASVLWSRGVCERGTARAVFVNSGNANACTGDPGLRDVESTAAQVASGLGVAREEVCVCSTGVIGLPLPMDRIGNGIRGCLDGLSREGGPAAAEAIMTTDTVPKEVAVTVALSGGTVTIGGMAKGAGMIAPNMATLLGFITTDASIEPGPLADVLRRAVDRSFNAICVDNDSSTNDTILCLANGASGVSRLEPGTADFDRFAEALTGLCQDLAQRLVRDGEGATKFVTIHVAGTRTDSEAKTIARSVAYSQLCKTAFYGNDANWGRIACAVGYAGVPFDSVRLDIWLDDVQVMAGGGRGDYREEDATDRVKRPEFTVTIRVGDGPGEARFWTSDLSLDYVRINAEYRS